jgi:hypothetical protein
MKERVQAALHVQNKESVEQEGENKEKSVTLQMIFDEGCSAREFFLEKNPHVARAIQNLELFSPKASDLFALFWFIAYGQGVLDTIGINDHAFYVDDINNMLFGLHDYSKEQLKPELSELP